MDDDGASPVVDSAPGSEPQSAEAALEQTLRAADGTMLLTFTPMLLALLLTGLLMPLLSKLKFPGMEAELQQTQVAIGQGPSGRGPDYFVGSSIGLIVSKREPIDPGPR